MSEQNVALVRQTFEAFKEGGFEAMLPFFPADLEWHPAPGWVEDVIYHGYEGARRMSAIWTDNFEGLQLELKEIRDIGERVLVLAEATGRAREGGMPISQPYGAVYSGFADCKIAKVQFFFTWQEALETVGLSE
jgi:ketosteroid isomerase-like protein